LACKFSKISPSLLKETFQKSDYTGRGVTNISENEKRKSHEGQPHSFLIPGFSKVACPRQGGASSEPFKKSIMSI